MSDMELLIGAIAVAAIVTVVWVRVRQARTRFDDDPPEIEPALEVRQPRPQPAVLPAATADPPAPVAVAADLAPPRALEPPPVVRPSAQPPVVPEPTPAPSQVGAASPPEPEPR